MCNLTWISEPGEENYVFRQMDIRAKQLKAVKAKVIDDGSLPTHTIQRLFITNKNTPYQNEEIFLNWLEFHSIRPKRSPPPVKPDVQTPPSNENDPEEIVMCAVMPQEDDNRAFEITSDGMCHPSTQFRGYYPQCSKSHSFEIGKDSIPDSYFTLQEKESFLHVLRAQDFDALAGSMADQVMESMKLGYVIKSQNGGMLEVERDAGWWHILKTKLKQPFQQPSLIQIHYRARSHSLAIILTLQIFLCFQKTAVAFCRKRVDMRMVNIMMAFRT
ncbi:MAG: hypothetical protein HWD61_10715 [Parachlamydiaceae bacterium]|nr:MAG: hypothetical protein HWD61_10715 [Parachlamydiaceae bacterium]